MEGGGRGQPDAVFGRLDSMRKGNLDRLKSMREIISSSQMGLTGRSWNVSYVIFIGLIRDFCMAGKVQAALLLRRKMINNSFVPDVLTHICILYGLCQVADLETADILVREMVEIGPSPNCSSYNIVIKGSCLANNVDKALFFFSAMVNCGFRPNKGTFNQLVRAICNRGLLEQARKLLGEILDDENFIAASDLIVSTMLMDGCVKNGDMVQAVGIWDEMLQKNIDMDVVSYNVLINGFSSMGDMGLAYACFCRMLICRLMS